jgi:hypothetical protein
MRGGARPDRVPPRARPVRSPPPRLPAHRPAALPSPGPVPPPFRPSSAARPRPLSGECTHRTSAVQRPGTTGAAAPKAAYPAVYDVSLDEQAHVATVQPLFYDEALAATANSGAAAGNVVRLALTDPDSNEVVPDVSPRFRGDFMLTSQGDQEQIYVSRAGTRNQALSVPSLSQSVDDTAWAASSHGRLYATDTGGDTVDVVTGWFRPGTAFVAVTPCGSNSAPATCPAPPAYPANYLGVLNMSTGQIGPVTVGGATLQPQGLLFVSP